LQSTVRGVAATVDCPNRWVALDPERGAMAAVAEAARNLSCVGAEPLAVTDNLNFPSPETDRGYWQLALACRGLSEACRGLNTPVTGGNVSLYNETRGDDGVLTPIHPTPVVGMVGMVADIDKVCGLAWRQAGDAVVLLGASADQADDDRVGLAGSSYQGVLHGLLTGRPPRVDLDLEARVQATVRQAIDQGLLASAHDCSDGGLAVALAESCLASGHGAEISLPASSTRVERRLFAEGGARIVVSVKAERRADWEALLASAQVPVQALGTVADHQQLKVVIDGQTALAVGVDALANSFEQALPRRLEAV
jgi:phosphoribosylformylglycinamidine synthase